MYSELPQVTLGYPNENFWEMMEQDFLQNTDFLPAVQPTVPKNLKLKHLRVLYT